MDKIKVILMDLPHSIKGFTVYYFDEDGQSYYTIMINSHLCSAAQCKTYDHEIRHIDNRDFDSMFPVDVLEGIRHTG